MTGAAAAPLLRVIDLVKAFPDLVALDRVSLRVEAGEVVAVVGHNGSGKSTLVKILAGVHRADGGMVETAPGTELHFIHQDLGLVGELTAAENLALAKGTGPASVAPSRGRTERERTRALIGRFGPVFDVDVPVRGLTPAQRAVVAISRALDGWTHPANVIVLDEPTESLHRGEVDVLFDAVRRVAGGDAVFSPRLAGFVLDSFTGRSAAPEPPLDPELDSLTPRELEVLRLLARGYTYREIAEELVISVKTVETHASNVLRKTQQSNRNALTRWAHRRRID